MLRIVVDAASNRRTAGVAKHTARKAALDAALTAKPKATPYALVLILASACVWARLIEINTQQTGMD